MSSLDFDQMLIKALKEKDTATATTIRALKSSVKNREIEKGSALEDSEVIEVLAKELKKRKDARDIYIANGRAELAQDEETEIAIIASLLPEQLTGDALKERVTGIIQGLSEEDRTNTGKAMGAIMKELKGQADGGEIQAIVKELA